MCHCIQPSRSWSSCQRPTRQTAGAPAAIDRWRRGPSRRCHFGPLARCHQHLRTLDPSDDRLRRLRRVPCRPGKHTRTRHPAISLGSIQRVEPREFPASDKRRARGQCRHADFSGLTGTGNAVRPAAHVLTGTDEVFRQPAGVAQPTADLLQAGGDRRIFRSGTRKMRTVRKARGFGTPKKSAVPNQSFWHTSQNQAVPKTRGFDKGPKI